MKTTVLSITLACTLAISVAAYGSVKASQAELEKALRLNLLASNNPSLACDAHRQAVVALGNARAKGADLITTTEQKLMAACPRG